MLYEAMKLRGNESKVVEEGGSSREKALLSESISSAGGGETANAPPSAAGEEEKEEVGKREEKMMTVTSLEEDEEEDDEMMIKRSSAAGSRHEEEEEEELGTWGFKDSRFAVTDADHVMMTGKRYALSGRRLPGLLRFFGQELGVTLSARNTWSSSSSSLPRLDLVVSPVVFSSILTKLQSICPAAGQVSINRKHRCRHGVGHALEDVVNLRMGRVGRVPDIVVWPHSEEQVEALVRLAKEEGSLCLLPFGGGTNVSLALQCSAKEGRVVVSVDMRKMNRVLWVNEEDGVAEIQAGAVGRHLAKALAGWGSGWTLGEW